jgi:hypothetical protein
VKQKKQEVELSKPFEDRKAYLRSAENMRTFMELESTTLARWDLLYKLDNPEPCMSEQDSTILKSEPFLPEWMEPTSCLPRPPLSPFDDKEDTHDGLTYNSCIRAMPSVSSQLYKSIFINIAEIKTIKAIHHQLISDEDTINTDEVRVKDVKRFQTRETMFKGKIELENKEATELLKRSLIPMLMNAGFDCM